jgi:hypothetical protein
LFAPCPSVGRSQQGREERAEEEREESEGLFVRSSQMNFLFQSNSTLIIAVAIIIISRIEKVTTQNVIS